MFNLKIIFFAIVFGSNIIYSQVTEKNIIDFVKNGIALSTYVHLKNTHKIGEYLKKNGYTYYEMNEVGKLGFSNIDNPVSKLLVINNNDKIGGVIFGITMDDFDTFITYFNKVINVGVPGIMYKKYIEQYKNDPRLTIINDKLSMWKDNNGVKTYSHPSNFLNSVIDGDENRKFFTSPDGAVIINIINITGYRYVQFQSLITDEYWVELFLKKDLNEVIWSQ